MGTETDQLREEGINFMRRVALSREEGMKCQHVQDLVKEDGELVYKLWVEEEGTIFVCGKVAMAEDVEIVLRNILERYGSIDQQQAVTVMKKMKSEGRYQLDLFG